MGTHLLRRLVTAGIRIRYHGDFDWPGVGIAAMSKHGLAVHEEFVLADLLADLAIHPAEE